MQRMPTAEWDVPLCEELLNDFTMFPDVHDEVLHEFLKGTSLYRAIIWKTNVVERLAETILWALEHKGNLVIEIFGRQRHGKSTVARLIARLIYAIQQKTDHNPTKCAWEDRVIYDRSFSSMTHKIKDLVEGWLDDGHTEDEILEKIKHYIFIFDEVYIEHEKDSIKARNDLTNLLNTVARAGIHFIFISPKRRGIGAYFSLWVIGYNTAHTVNLSFYFDTNMQCKGYMITPQIKETEKYEAAKTEGILEMLRSGGRHAAKVKELDKLEEVPVTPTDITIGDDFRPYAVERATREYTDRTYSQVLDLIMQNIPQAQVAERVFGNPEKQMQVSRIMKDIGTKRLGYWFEDWWCLKNGLTPNTNKTAPIPDAIYNGTPHSLKCHYTNRRTVTLQADDLFPEIEYARAHQTPVILVYHNLIRNLTITRTFPSADAVPARISLNFTTKTQTQS